MRKKLDIPGVAQLVGECRRRRGQQQLALRLGGEVPAAADRHLDAHVDQQAQQHQNNRRAQQLHQGQPGGAVKKKLKNARGETLVELMASILIGTLSTALLLGGVPLPP